MAEITKGVNVTKGVNEECSTSLIVLMQASSSAHAFCSMAGVECVCSKGHGC